MTPTYHPTTANQEPPPSRPYLAIANDYFAAHPEAKADVTRKGELLIFQFVKHPPAAHPTWEGTT